MNQGNKPHKTDDLLSFHALILAAGKGTRTGRQTPKQFQQLGGKAVLTYSIDIFNKIPSCRSICIVTDAQYVPQVQKQFKSQKITTIVAGGEERNNSVHNGLKSFSNLKNEEIILIHDAARPCVKTADIENLLLELKKSRAGTLAVPVNATLRKGGNDNQADENVSRDNLWAIQTPQGFRYGDILQAHKEAQTEKSYTDDTALLSEKNIPVKLVEGSPDNIKITYHQDFEMAEKLLSQNTATLIGQGFDVHAFDRDSKGPIRLCGVDIPHAHALKGHSDADVGLHALTDAILGATGEGDIGRHFPPSNPDFKDMDSAIFLEKAMDILREKSGTLNNIDLTLICEEPKITPHAEAMSERISKITGLNKARINIKATTSEGLGFTGRKEGIAAQAIVTVSILDQS